MSTTDPEATKAGVRSHWEEEPCGSGLADARLGSPEFFAEVTATRDRLEPYIAAFADFESAAGKDVLEIGVGLGSDHVRFARAGARMTGVDLTQAAIDLTRRRLALEGLRSDLRTADAESLPFPDDRFDVVYSWGVLHHTPDSDRAIAEALRVLRPGGQLCVMLYARRSWTAIGLWARHALLKARPWRSLRDVLGHHLESPGTRGFSLAELQVRFGSLEDLRVVRATAPADRRVAGPVADMTERWLGFYLVVRGTSKRS